jgi:hypothetical protein
MAGLEIDDAQAAYTQRARTIKRVSFVVGPTVANLVTHEPGCSVFGDTVTQHETGYAAHTGAGLRNCIR